MNLKIYIRFTDSANKFLFTHAGVVKEWVNSIDDLNNIDITKPSILNQVPKSRGGDNSLDNLQYLTVFENLSKRDMTMEEWNNFKKETNTHSDFYIESILKGGQDHETVF